MLPGLVLTCEGERLSFREKGKCWPRGRNCHPAHHLLSVLVFITLEIFLAFPVLFSLFVLVSPTSTSTVADSYRWVNHTVGNKTVVEEGYYYLNNFDNILNSFGKGSFVHSKDYFLLHLCSCRARWQDCGAQVSLGLSQRVLLMHLKCSASCSFCLENSSWLIVPWLFCKVSRCLLKASVKPAGLFWLVIRPAFQRCLWRASSHCPSKEPIVMLIHFFKPTDEELIWMCWLLSNWFFLTCEQRCLSPGDFRGPHAL